jgi:hypothetical protein
MSVVEPAARILRAIESLRNAEGSLNRVINGAVGSARSSAQEASGSIEHARHELKLAFQELQLTENARVPPACKAD